MGLKIQSIQNKVFVQYECSHFNKEIKYNFEIYQLENSKYPKWSIHYNLYECSQFNKKIKFWSLLVGKFKVSKVKYSYNLYECSQFNKKNKILKFIGWKIQNIQNEVFVQFIYKCSQFNKEIKYNFEVWKFKVFKMKYSYN